MIVFESLNKKGQKHGKLDVGTSIAHWRESVLHQTRFYFEWHSEVARKTPRGLWQPDDCWDTVGKRRYTVWKNEKFSLTKKYFVKTTN